MRVERSGSGAARPVLGGWNRRRTASVMTVCSVVASTLAGVFLFFSHNAMATTWQVQTVDSNGNVGQFTSIALDSEGDPRIAYYDATKSDVKYAEWNGSTWSIETVDSYDYVGQFLSMALDASGSPHLAYYNGTGNSLKYARWNGTDWNTATVDSNGAVGLHTSIAVNASGHPRIAYYDAGNHDLKYAKLTGTSWSIEPVDWDGNVGSYASLSLNASGSPRISYYDATNGDLKLASWNGNSWDVQVVDSAGDVGQYTSIKVGSNDSVHISYYDVTKVHLKYARWQGGSWIDETVDSANFVGKFSSLGLDGAGFPRISYYDDSASALKYARWNGSAWNLEVVDSPGVGEYSSIGIDQGGIVHISYHDLVNHDLKYATGLGNEGPETPPPPSGPPVVRVLTSHVFAALTTDPEGDQIRYTFSWGDNSVSHTGYVESGTQVNASHSWSIRGQYPVRVLATDIHGMQSVWSGALTVAVVSTPGPPRNLGAAAGNGEVILSWTPPADDGGTPITNYTVFRGTGSKQESALTTLGNVSAYSDTGLENGRTYYYFVTARNAIGEGQESEEASATPATLPGEPRNLMATPGDGQVLLHWTPPDDDGGSPIVNYSVYRGAGPGAEIRLETIGDNLEYVDRDVVNGDAYYYVVTAMNLKGEGLASGEANATPRVGLWSIETVDSSWDVGQYSSIGVDLNGRPFIAYYDATNRDLKCARWENGAWLVETVDMAGDVGSHASMAVDSLGNPRISYYDATQYRVKYAHWDGSGWAIEVAQWAVSDSDTSLALDRQDRPHIALTDSNHGSLKYVYWNGTSWEDEVVGQFDVGTDASIALNETDQPRISYWIRDLDPDSKPKLVVAFREWLFGSWTWASQTVDLPNVGPHSSIAVDTDGAAHISYLDSGSYDIKHAKLTTSTVSNETIEEPEVVLGDTSIKIASSGTVFISYYSWSYGDLKMAKSIGNGWSIERVDTAGDVGQYSSIAVDDLGYAHISYYDALNRSLKYARGLGNSLPNAPSTPIGPVVGVVGKEYAYTTSAVDPDGDKIRLSVDWGDGTTTSTDYIDSGAISGLSHTWKTRQYFDVKVKAIDVHGGSSPWSLAISVRIDGSPSAPRNLTAIAGDNQVFLLWLAPTDDGGLPVTNYTIHRGITPDHEVFLAETGARSFVDADVVNGGSYYYRVRAKNAVGEGPDSNEVKATPLAVPSEPTGLRAVAGNAQIMLNWTLPNSTGGSPITNYTIYRGTVPGGETLLVQVPTVFIYLDMGLANGVTYYYIVRAVNALGEGAYSSEASAKPMTIPEPPRNLIATPASNEVTLTWTAPAFDGGSPVINYTVYRGEWWGAESKLTEIGTVTSYTDSGLTNGRSYYYAVTAKNGIGEGGWSNQVKAVPASLPGPPGDLVAVAGDSKVTLTWMPPMDNGGHIITNYSVWRGTSPGGGSLLTVVGENPKFVDIGLTNGVTYYYAVAAITGQGQGPNSTEASARPATMPVAPGNLQASAGNRQVAVSWAAPPSDGGSPITNYTLYWGYSSNGEIFAIRLGNVTSYDHAGLANGRAYFYETTAINDIGESPRSVEASAIPATIPGAPTGLVATIESGQIVLKWQPPSDDGGFPVLNYTIYRGTSSIGKSILDTIGASTFYVDSAASVGMTYYYEVAAENSRGSGPSSNEAVATLLGRPSAPRNVAAAAGDHMVRLSWAGPLSDGGRPVQNYRVYRGLAPGILAFVAEMGNVTMYDDSPLSNGQRYYYAVSATNEIGEGPASADIPAIPGAVPGQPRAFEATAKSRRVSLTWLPPSEDGGFPVTNYRILRGTVSGQETQLVELTSVSTYLDTGLTNGVTYYYRVAAVNSLGPGPPAAEVNATPMDARPTCGISSPAWSTTVSGTWRILGLAGDEEGNLQSVEVKIDDGDWTTATGLESWSLDWDTRGLTNGMHRVYARSFDGRNYSGDAMVTVFVENFATEKPREKSIFEEPWFWVVTAVTMIAIILMFLLLIRGRRRKSRGIESFLEYLSEDEK